MRIAVAAVACLALTGCPNYKDKSVAEGKPITAEFLKTYQGRFVEKEFGEELEISADGKFVRKQYRQVGREGDRIPYPTTCTYFQEGRLTGVFKRTPKDIANYMDYADTKIKVTFTKTRLDRAGKQEPLESCDLFEKTSGRVGGNYTLYAELLDGNRIRLHTAGGGDQKPGQPRTQSTLDEVFERVLPTATAPAPEEAAP